MRPFHELNREFENAQVDIYESVKAYQDAQDMSDEERRTAEKLREQKIEDALWDMEKLPF